MGIFTERGSGYNWVVTEVESGCEAVNKNEDHRIRLLVVDDDDDILALVSAGLANNFDVTTTSDAFKTVEFLETDAFDIVVLDVEMPMFRGTDLGTMIRGRFPKLGGILFTAYNQPEMVAEVALSGADAYIAKPFCLNEMAREIREVYAAKRGE